MDKEKHFMTFSADTALLIPAYRFTYWVLEMISKTLDWAFRTLTRVVTSIARFCITSLTWWCGLFAPRKETTESTYSGRRDTKT